MIVALIEFVTAVWLSLYMGWAVSSLRLLNRFTNTLLGCCGREYEDIYYEREESMKATKGHGNPYDAAEAGEGEVRWRAVGGCLEGGGIMGCGIRENVRRGDWGKGAMA